MTTFTRHTLAFMLVIGSAMPVAAQSANRTSTPLPVRAAAAAKAHDHASAAKCCDHCGAMTASTSKQANDKAAVEAKAGASCCTHQASR
jgi:hypothetical protein